MRPPTPPTEPSAGVERWIGSIKLYRALAQAPPGRTMIAKPFRSYLPAVNEMSAPGVTEPTLALAAGNPDPLRRAPATG